MSDSFLDQMKALGAKLGLPKVDVDRLVEMNRKNFEAFMRSASVAGEGAKALADKQREIVQAAFKETATMVKDFHPTGSAQEIVAKQREYARKAFEVAMQNMRDLAELATKSTAESARIIRERIHDNLSEWQESVSASSGGEEKKEVFRNTLTGERSLKHADRPPQEALIHLRWVPEERPTDGAM